MGLKVIWYGPRTKTITHPWVRRWDKLDKIEMRVRFQRKDKRNKVLVFLRRCTAKHGARDFIYPERWWKCHPPSNANIEQIGAVERLFGKDEGFEFGYFESVRGYQLRNSRFLCWIALMFVKDIWHCYISFCTVWIRKFRLNLGKRSKFQTTLVHFWSQQYFLRQ